MIHRASPTISSGSSCCIVRIIEADVEKVEVARLFLDHHQQKQFRRITEFTLKVSFQSNWDSKSSTIGIKKVAPHQSSIIVVPF